MSIWYEDFTIENVKTLRDNTLNKHLGIEFLEIGADHILAKMPVDDRTRQSRGMLHGGASCVLAESLGSIASNLCINMRKQKAVGLEINANHLRPIFKGYVTGKATPINIGKTIHVWGIDITNESGKLSCVSRLTTAIINLNKDEILENTDLLNKVLI